MSLAYARNDWYVIADKNSLEQGPRRTRLLGDEIHVSGSFAHPVIKDTAGRTLPTQIKFDHVWTTVGDNPRALFDIPEGREPGRRLVPCGMVRVKCSPLRAVELQCGRPAEQTSGGERRCFRPVALDRFGRVHGLGGVDPDQSDLSDPVNFESVAIVNPADPTGDR